MKAVVIKPNGERTEVSPENGTDFNLQELYKIIGTDMIEVLYLPGGKIMIIDEEGKLKTNPQINSEATNIFGFDLIMGVAVIADEKMLK